MATNAYIGINGVARKVKAIDVGVNNIARKVTKGYIGVNGIARLFYTAVDVNVISDADIGRYISNGYIYNGRMWVYSWYTKTLYGASLSGQGTVSIPITSSSTGFSEMVTPLQKPICLTILDGYLFLTQWRTGSASLRDGLVPTNSGLTVLSAPDFTGDEESLLLSDEFSQYTQEVYSLGHSLPYVQKETVNGVSYFVMCVGDYDTSRVNSSYTPVYGYYNEVYWQWEVENKSISKNYRRLFCISKSQGGIISPYTDMAVHVIYCFNKKNNNEMIYFQSGNEALYSETNNIYSSIRNLYATNSTETGAPKSGPVTTEETAIAGIENVYIGGAYDGLVRYIPFDNPKLRVSVDISENITLPNGSQRFADAAVYCPDRDIWLFFVGTGLIYTSDLTDANSYLFFNTQESIGTLTRFGYMDYVEDTSQLVIVGQDANSNVKVATISVSNFV